jgi:hypothetical protein
MGHEPWHIEALGGAAEKYARQGIQTSPMDYRTRVPFTSSDEIAQERAREERKLTYVQAAMQSVQQDWLISQMLSSQGKNPIDPNWNATPDLLKGDERIKNLPPNYLNYLGQSSSQQDYDWRVRQALRDHEIEQKLNESHPYLRMAVSMADPAGLALGALSPASAIVGKGVQLSRLGRLGVLAADGAAGALMAELPALMDKPGYEESQALTAALIGSAGYLALNRATWAKNPEIAKDVEEFVNRARDVVDGPAFGGSSAGAAQSAYRDAVRSDVYDFLDLKTEKSGRSWMDRVRFDAARRKNSENPAVAAAADQLFVDSVGNRDKTKAVTRAVEYDWAAMEEKAGTLWARQYDAAAEDFRKRNNIGMVEWKTSKEAEFQRTVTAAVRNTDPLVQFDPAVQKVAGTWQGIAAFWRERARNPGKERGITLKSLSNADLWSDAPEWLPRYVNWEKWNALAMEHGNALKGFIGRAIRAKNPDLDPELANKLGGWYFDRLEKVLAGQELNQTKALTGLDLEMTKDALIKELGISAEEAEKALFHLEAKENAGKTITSRQKPRTQMDENYTELLNGRQVSINEIWEDNIHSIVHAYNHQMAGAVAMANFRIKNPNFGKIDGAPEFLVDGIRSQGDWQEFLRKVRAVDREVRPRDMRNTVEAEIKDLQWGFDRITGVPHEMDRTALGQAVRATQKANFMRLGAQMGFASIAEFGMIAGQVGWKYLLKGIPAISDFKRDIMTGRLAGSFADDLEAATAIGTTGIRGVGQNVGSQEMATNLQKTGLSTKLDAAERYLNVGSRAISMVSLLPITTIQERTAMNAVIHRMLAAAKGQDALNPQRMRLIGLTADTEKKVLGEMKKHAKDVERDGRKVPDLQLHKWDAQARSAFEYGVRMWTRRTIQANDLGQMNAMLGHPLAKLFFQFRSFTLGAWSKNTLSNIHMNDFETYHAFAASMAFGAMAYMAQVYLNAQGMGEKEKQKFLEERLDDKKIFAAAFQRAGFTSLMPGMIDTGVGLLGYDPLFNTRATQQPTQGLVQVPALGMVDNAYKGVHALTSSFLPQRQEDGSWERGVYTQKDFKATVNAINLLGNMPGLVNLINAGASNFPEK